MKCWIMQGLPGSGKSTWVKHNIPDPVVILSTDSYFMEEGVYRYDNTKLGEYHNKVLRQFIITCCEHHNVVVDNTNIRMFELAPYYRIAEAMGYEVEIVRLLCSPEVCKRRNIHGVPYFVIDRMAEKMEEVPPWWKIRTITE